MFPDGYFEKKVELIKSDKSIFLNMNLQRSR